MANKTENIILACENRDANSLIDNVDRILTYKLVKSIERKKMDIGKKLFTESTEELTTENAEWQDTYENYDPSVQVAIDYVVESVMDSGLELENTIQSASKQFNVSESTLKEYFNSLLEDSAEVVSTSSNDNDEKRGMRDDEDTNKRVRYEMEDPALKSNRNK
jgi:hypothetical protein